MDNQSNQLTNYDKKGLNRYLMPVESPITSGTFTLAMNFESSHEAVQGKVVIASKVGITNFVKQTIGTQSGGNFSGGSVLILSTTAGFIQPFTNKPFHADPYVAVYQGTGQAAADQIYPTLGINVTPGRYIIYGDHDRNRFNNTPIASWYATLIDTTGASAQQIVFATAWQYIDYTVGTT